MVADLLREIDLAGMVFSTEESSANKSPLLNLILKEADRRIMPITAERNGCCWRARPMRRSTPSRKIKNVSRIEPSVAITSNPEIILCHEVERVPPLRIAAQLFARSRRVPRACLQAPSPHRYRWPRGF